MLLWAWFSLLALILYLSVRAFVRVRYKKWSPRHQWKILLGVSVIALLPGTVYLEYFQPMAGIYSAGAAEYWMSRAASESDHSKKAEHVGRVALSSEYGSVVAKQAIDRVENVGERCRLRTILANLPNVRGQVERQHEARQECILKLKP